MKRVVSAPDPRSAPAIDWVAYEGFARGALEAFSRGEHADAVVLRGQLTNAEFVEFDYTGAGFFLKLRVPDESPSLSRSGWIGDLHAEAPGKQPLGLMLAVDNGKVSFLEAFAYADWPDDLSAYQFQYVRWEPHADGSGASAVNVSERDPASMWSG